MSGEFKKVFKKEGGVSEVIGNILMVAITVMLFTTMMWYVYTLPSPQPETYTQFDAWVDIDSGVANITIRNVAGESLSLNMYSLVVVIDNTPYRHPLSDFATQAWAADGNFDPGDVLFYSSAVDGVTTVTADSSIYVMIYNDVLYKVVWDSTLKGSVNNPPVILGAFSDPSPLQIGEGAVVSTIVFDPDPADDVSLYTVYMDLSSLGVGNVTLTYIGNNKFSAYVTIPDSVSLTTNYAVVVITVDYGSGYTVSTDSLLVSYSPQTVFAKLVVDENNIVLSDTTPTHTEDVSVTFSVVNLGGTAAKFRARFWDVLPNGTEVLLSSSIGNPTSEKYVAAGGETSITFIWQNVGGDGPTAGLHYLKIELINATGIDGSPIDASSRLNASIAVTVMPKILLVDDDQASLGSAEDTSTVLENILATVDYDYDVVQVVGAGPIEITGYDIIIWDTGYDVSTNAISLEQAYQLSDFLNAGGKVWVISQEVSVDSLRVIWGDTGLVKSLASTSSSYDIYGNPAADIDLSNPGGGVFNTTLVQRSSASTATNTYYVTFNPLSGTEALLNDSAGNAVAIYRENTVGGKMVYFGFAFPRIDHYYEQSFLAYKVLMWLGNITVKTGIDVAAADLLISNQYPLYSEEVNITVVVMNNGGVNVTTSVALYLDGEMVGNVPVSTGEIPAFGGYVFVNFTWVAEDPGTHYLDVYVDPYNLLQETNEYNNRLVGDMVDTSIYVQFSTIIVNNGTSTTDLSAMTQAFDDLDYRYTVLDFSTGYNPPPNYDDLGQNGFFSKYNLVIWIAGENDNPIGPRDGRVLKRYLSYGGHLWFVGTRISEGLDSTIVDGESLLSTFGVTIEGTITTSPFALIGINYKNGGDPVTRGMGLFYSDSDLTVGNGDIDVLGCTGGYAMFHDSYTTTGQMIEEYFSEESSPVTEGVGIRKVVGGTARLMITPIDPSSIRGIYGPHSRMRPLLPDRQSRAELVFRAMKWFGLQDDRVEVAVLNVDVDILGGDNQLVGHSYLIQAVIRNLGYEGTSVLVRFYEEGMLIGSDSIYVDGDSYTTAECLWTPLFAGRERHIRVVVDETNDVKEIRINGTFIEAFNYNNEAILTMPVYYFWDDMENGGEYWSHEATVVSITGEGPLDFLPREDANVNVVGEWDLSYSNYFYNTTDNQVVSLIGNVSYTPPRAFWFPEVYSSGGGGRQPLDIFLVVDNSGSMRDDPDGDGVTKWEDLVNAVTSYLIPNLTADDYLTIIAFGVSYNVDVNILNYVLNDISEVNEIKEVNNYEAVYVYFNRAPMTAANRNAANATLNSMNPQFYTPIWDAIGVGVCYAKYYNDTEDAAAGRLPVVIALTDGADWGRYRGPTNIGSETSISAGNSGPLGGSELFAPWFDWGIKRTTPGDIYADETGWVQSGVWNWYPIEFGSNGDQTRYGLTGLANEPDTGAPPHIGGKIPVITIGLGLMHVDPPSAAKLDNTHYSHDAGTAEYWLWKIAATSTAPGFGIGYDGYLYAAQSSELGSIFSSITSAVTGTGQIQSIGLPDISPKSTVVLPLAAPPTISATPVTLFYDGFEGGLSNWVVSQSAGPGWELGDGGTGPWGAYRGTYYALYSQDGDRFNYDDLYTASGITIPANAAWAVVSFSVRWSITYSGLHVMVNDGTGWDYVGYVIGDSDSGWFAGTAETPLNETSTADDEWLVFSADLSNYAGKTIQIGFEVEDDTQFDTEYFTVDEVKVAYQLKESTSGGGGGAAPSTSLPYERYRWTVTEPIDLSGVQEATLSFWTKYWSLEGTNGAMIYVWVYNTTTSSWTWQKWDRYYILPKQSYTGNLYIDEVNKDALTGGPGIAGVSAGLVDANGNYPYWCFNGRSGKGTFTWEYVEADLSQFVGNVIRVVFIYAQYGGDPSTWRPEMGFYVDDVQVRVTRSGSLNDASPDQWSLANISSFDPTYGAHSGYKAWVFNMTTGALKPGVDSSLISTTIDLTSAKNATFIAWFRFNINESAGLPPDVIRVEVSDDGGMTWKSITYGVRMSWGYSGKYGDLADGIADGKSYSGINASGYGWVRSTTLTRLNCDLSGWAGRAILIRIRVVTTSDPAYTHYDNALYPMGIYVDDVAVIGESNIKPIPISWWVYV